MSSFAIDRDCKAAISSSSPELDWHRGCFELRPRLMRSQHRKNSSMPANASTENYAITRPRAPGWLSCELCERPASRPHRRLRLTLVRHQGADPCDSIADAASGEAAHPAMLVLLCADCCAVIVGTIDDDEWRRRTHDSLTTMNRPQLPPPSSTVPPAEAEATSIASA